MSAPGLSAQWCKKFASVATLTALCLSLLVGASGVASAQNDSKQAIAMSLATLLRVARSVVSDAQPLINDHTKGDKGFTGKIVVAAAKHSYRLETGVDLDSIDPSSLHGQLIAAEMAAIIDVIDEVQDRINQRGVGFKGFLPAIFAARVAERFSAKKGTIAEIKLTAPRDYIRNRDNLPDKWEHSVIEDQFKSTDHPLGQPVSAANALKNGRPAFRLILPEYYKLSCLSCHGEPKGKHDITGGKKEGGVLGELGGSISVVIYLR